MVISSRSASIVQFVIPFLLEEHKVETRLIGYTNGVPTDIDLSWHVYADDQCSGSPLMYAQFDGEV